MSLNSPAPYGKSAALVVGTPNPNTISNSVVSGLLVTATVAGNAVVKLDDGGNVTVALAVGTTLFPFCVIEIVSQTATATYYQLAE